MSDAFDLAVVGAGPGGLAAAATAAEAGLRVCLIDDNPDPGGQIWRRGIVKHSVNSAATKWLYRIQKSRVEVRSGWRVVAVSPAAGHHPASLRIERDGKWGDVQYSASILATGARELFLPFPGWTLPGVYGAGGLQAFVKSGFDISGKRIVIAGTGPLLLAVAAALRKAGAQIPAVVEQAPLNRLARFSLSLLAGHAGKLIEGAGYRLKTLGTPYRTGSWVSYAKGVDHLKSVVVTNRASSTEIDTDMLAVGFHLVPNTELAQLLRCELAGGYVRVDALQQTSVSRVYCVGEATGIGGVEKAQLEGRIAALAVSGQVDQAISLSSRRDRQLQFVQSLASAFQLRNELRSLATDMTIVCRCEDVSHGSLKQCCTWREAKLHTRCGMGPCQGRICSAATHFLYGWDIPQPRPPLFPVDITTLGSLPESCEAQIDEAVI